MTMTLDQLRKSRGVSNYSKLTEAIDKIQNPNGGSDDRFWKPERDKAGNAKATIRFLSVPGSDDLPWVRYWDHSFKGPTGKWYIEKNLTSIGKDDPVSELNSKLYATGIDENKKIASKQKRRLHFVSNILVINDPKNPENNGKVFLFKYGKKIFEKIISKQKPSFEDETPVVIWDLWEGADFELKIKTVDEYPNYDESNFKDPKPLLNGNDEKILEAVNGMYSLAEFVDPANYKSYDELKKRLELVLDLDGSGGGSSTAAKDRSEFSAAPTREASAPASRPAPAAKSASSDDDDDLSYFKTLGNDLDIGDDDIPF